MNVFFILEKVSKYPKSRKPIPPMKHGIENL